MRILWLRRKDATDEVVFTYERKRRIRFSQGSFVFGFGSKGMRGSAIAAIGAGLIATMGTIGTSDAAVFSYVFESFDLTVNAFGTLDATDQGGGEYLVTAMTGSISGSGVTAAITGVAPINPPGFNTNNLLFAGSDPVLDSYGIGFYTASGLDWNVWGTAPGNYTLYASDGAGNYPVEQTGAFSVAAIPEASSWAMMLAGFASLGFAAFRARRPAVSIA